MSDDDSFTSESQFSLSGLWGESDFSAGDIDTSFGSASNASAPSTPKKNRPITSTPGKGKGSVTPKGTTESSLFKKPFGTCPTCRKVLKTDKGFNNHLLNHRIKDAAGKHYSVESCLISLREEVPNMISKIISTSRNDSEDTFSLAVKISSQESSEEWADFVTDTLEIIKGGLEGKSASLIMPQALRSRLQETVNFSLCDKELCAKLYAKFQLVTPCNISLFSLFLFDFLRECVDMCILFICKSMQGGFSKPTDKLMSSKGDTNNQFAQLLHHVAGFALYHLISHAKKFPKNEKLLRMKNCILSKFAQTGVLPVLDREDKAHWTHLLNRKKLMFVSAEAFPFFIELGSVLMASEERDGSVLLEKVCKNVVGNSKCLVMWDAIVDNFLDQTESFDVLIKMVKVIARTYGRGNMLKKMNLMNKSTKANKKTLSISHRAGVI